MALDFVERLGIQSWCFRGYKTHEEVVEALRACDVDRIELSGAHIKPWEIDDPAAVVKFYEDHGVEISAYGGVQITADRDRARKVFDFARLAKFDTLTVFFGEGGIETAESLCEEYGMKVALHNHGRRMRYGAPWELDEVFEKTSLNVGLCLDTAWMLDSGRDPLEMAERYADRLYGVHVKDFVFDRAGRPKDIIVGEGNLDLPGFLATLDKIKFDGYFTLEYEGDIDNPIPATKQCVEAVRKAAREYDKT